MLVVMATSTLAEGDDGIALLHRRPENCAGGGAGT